MSDKKAYEQDITITYILCTLACIALTPNGYKMTMLYYMSILSISLFLVTLSSKMKTNINSKIFFWIGIFIFGSVMAFRLGSGIDDWQYKKIFTDVSGKNIFQYLSYRDEESGYLIINYLLFKITGGNYQITQPIITYISFIIWGKAIWSEDPENKKLMPLMLLILWTNYYFLIMGAALVRIFIAIPIVFHAIKKLINEEYKMFYIYLLIASLFHISSLIMIILTMFIKNRKFFYEHWVVFILLCIFIVPLLFLIIGKYIVPLMSAAKYGGYAQISSFKISIGSFSLMPILVVGLILFNQISLKMKNHYIISMILIGLSIAFELADSMVGIGRVAYYSNLGVLIGIPVMQNIQRKNKLDVLLLLMLIVYNFVYMMHVSVNNASHFDNLFPYTSYWVSDQYSTSCSEKSQSCPDWLFTI